MSGEALLRELRSLRILIVHPIGSERDELIQQLKRIGCQVHIEWPKPSFIGPGYGAVFCLIDEGMDGQALGFTRPEVPLIAIMQFESPTVIRAVLESGATGIINKPIRPNGILTALIMARSIHRYEANQEKKIAKLKDSLKSRQLIDRAVQTLSELKTIGIDEAYELIRQQATSKRVSMSVIAEAILNAGGLLAASPSTKSNRPHVSNEPASLFPVGVRGDATKRG
ncbi:MAG: Aliphatic amidase regulator [Nitrosomonadaceae bacterium]|nr:Aliphatic amidase regulator [Nitrosomonadaceae bacterium]